MALGIGEKAAEGRYKVLRLKDSEVGLEARVRPLARRVDHLVLLLVVADPRLDLSQDVSGTYFGLSPLSRCYRYLDEALESPVATALH